MLATVALLSLTKYYTSNSFFMENMAAYRASELYIPIPTSDERMAMRSFAPSPHIPIFGLNYPNSFFMKVYLLYSSVSFSLSFEIINALFSGEILAKSFIFYVKIGVGSIFKKLLSTTIGKF